MTLERLKSEIETLLHNKVKEKYTGSIILSFNMSQGGIGNIEVVEKRCIIQTMAENVNREFRQDI